MTEPKPSNDRNGNFLDPQWCCKVCDGEIPDGHLECCDIWKLEKKLNGFIANEYSTALDERDALAAQLATAQERLREAERLLSNPDLMQLMHYAAEAHGLELWDADRRTWLAGGAKEGE